MQTSASFGSQLNRAANGKPEVCHLESCGRQSRSYPSRKGIATAILDGRGGPLLVPVHEYAP